MAAVSGNVGIRRYRPHGSRYVGGGGSASVDREYGSADIGRLVGQHEDGGSGDLLGLTDDAEVVVLDPGRERGFSSNSRMRSPPVSTNPTANVLHRMS